MQYIHHMARALRREGCGVRTLVIILTIVRLLVNSTRIKF
jgi:hypothetical protein